MRIVVCFMPLHMEIQNYCKLFEKITWKSFASNVILETFYGSSSCSLINVLRLFCLLTKIPHNKMSGFFVILSLIAPPYWTKYFKSLQAKTHLDKINVLMDSFIVCLKAVTYHRINKMKFTITECCNMSGGWPQYVIVMYTIS